MMPDEMDRDIRERFARLRGEERASAGAFRVAARGLAGQRLSPRRRQYRLGAALAAAAAIVVAVLWLADGQSPATPEAAERAAVQDFSVVMGPLSFDDGGARRTPLQLAWRTPTDALLDTPGRELLRDLPNLDVSSYGTLTGLATRHPKRARPAADSTSSRVATPRSPT